MKNAQKKPLCGIYRVNHISGFYYVGQSLDINARFRRHKWCIKKNYQNRYTVFNRLWKEDGGFQNFTLEIIEICKPEQLDERETYWLTWYNDEQRTNILSKPNVEGHHFSTEVRMKNSIGHLNERKGKRLNRDLQTVIYDSNGNIHVVTNLHAFCREHELNYGNMYQVIAGLREHHKGYCSDPEIILKRTLLTEESAAVA